MKRERAEECAKRLDDFMTELFHNLKGGRKELAAHAGLTVPQLFALKMVESKEGCKMGDLAKALHLHFGTATSIVDRLVRDGLLSRKRDDADRRVVRLYLTRQGEETISKINEERRNRLTDYIEKLDEADFSLVIEIFSKVMHVPPAEPEDTNGELKC